MKLKHKYKTFITANCGKALGILVGVAFINIIAGAIAILASDSVCVISSLLAFLFSARMIANLVGYQFGRMINMHLFRWRWLKNHDRESDYRGICLNHLCVMLPIGALWSLINLSLSLL